MVTPKTYVVTGASRGLGLECVKQLLDREGVKVVAGARNPSSASALQDLGKAHPDRLKIVKLDQDDEQSTKARHRFIWPHEVFAGTLKVEAAFTPPLVPLVWYLLLRALTAGMHNRMPHRR